MRIRILHRDKQVSPEMRAYVERRLLFALSRFAPKMDRITVDLSVKQEPKGEAMTSCEISIALRRSPRLDVSVKEADLETAVARAAERAGRAVARSLEQKQAAMQPISHSIR